MAGRWQVRDRRYDAETSGRLDNVIAHVDIEPERALNTPEKRDARRAYMERNRDRLAGIPG